MLARVRNAPPSRAELMLLSLAGAIVFLGIWYLQRL